MDKNLQVLCDKGYGHYKKGELKEAVDCFREAGEKGHHGAVYVLIQIYESPEYVIPPEDFVDEIKHFADLGNYYAMINLGRLMAGSKGAPIRGLGILATPKGVVSQATIATLPLKGLTLSHKFGHA